MSGMRKTKHASRKKTPPTSPRLSLLLTLDAIKAIAEIMNKTHPKI
jgi:hypothetical protein